MMRRLIVMPILALAAIPAIALADTTPANRAQAKTDCTNQKTPSAR
jgi:hypothetical protein